MSSPKHITIIGDGIAGLACARQCIKANFKVTVIADSKLVSASRVASGLSMVKGSRIPRDRLYRLKTQGHELLQELLNEVNVKFSSDVYEPYVDANDYTKIRTRSFGGQFSALMGTSHCDDAKSQPQPLPLNETVRGFFIYHHECWFKTDELLNAIRAELLQRDCRFIDNRVISIRPNEDGRLKVLFVDQSFTHTDECVVAAGSGSSDILMRSQLYLPNEMQIFPGSVMKANFSWDRPFALTHLRSSALFFENKLQMYDGYIESLADMQRVYGTFAGLLRDLGKENPEVISAKRVGIKSREPLIGITKFLDQHTLKGVHILTAFYKSGFQYAEIAARLLVSHINTNIDSGQPYTSYWAQI